MFSFFQTSIIRSEAKPKAKLTDQTWREVLVVFPWLNKGVIMWRALIVPIHIYVQMKKNQIKYPIQFDQLGKTVEYLDENNVKKILGGWGKRVNRKVKEWLAENYGMFFFSKIDIIRIYLQSRLDIHTIDENTNLTYEHDDIRLCTIQRLTSDQRLGTVMLQNRNYQFYFIQLCSNQYTDLLNRSGLKNFDRIISINGVNIEQKTLLELIRFVRQQQHLPVQLLVCSPSTYEHYKLNHSPLHEHLPTVQRCKPVFYTKSSSPITSDKLYYIVYVPENESIVILPQSAIFKAPEYICVDDICFVEINEQYQRAQVLFIGTKNDCEKEEMKVTFDKNHDLKSKFLSITQCSNQKDAKWDIEKLPNELFCHVFQYIDASSLYNIFWGLNTHLNNLLQVHKNLCLNFNEKTDLSMTYLYASRIISLIIDTSTRIDFSQFTNLRALTLYKRNNEHLNQIQPSIIPNLTHLAFFLEVNFVMPSEILVKIFTGQFPLLRCVNLCQVNMLTLPPLSTSYSLEMVSLFTDQPVVIASTILTACPNLRHLRLLVLPSSQMILPKPKAESNHLLQRLTLWTDNVYLTTNIIETFFEHTPNLQHLYLQCVCNIPFVQFAAGFVKQLRKLSKFECYINELIGKDKREGDRMATDIHRLHPTFNDILCVHEDETCRIFATK